MSSEIACPECGRSFKNIGSHWRYHQDHRPELSEGQYNAAVGLLMGDGTINRGVSCNLACESTNEDYLDYLDDLFGILSYGVRLKHTQDESAELARESGFRPNAKADNYKAKYKWRTCTHPVFNDMASWYESGEKVWPDNINLTPTVLKHWYCGDGNLSKRGSHISITIGMSNEIENKKKLLDMFERQLLPKPKFTDYQGNAGRVGMARFNKEESVELLDYMGEPLPGFEYKWV